MGCDPADHAMDVIVDRSKIHIGRTSADTELRGMAIMGGSMTGREQGLGRDAAIIQAVAAHLAAFKKCNAGPHLDSTGRNGQATGPGTDHTYIDITNFAHDSNTTR